MNYYQWNKLIAKNIFDKKYGRRVFLYKSMEDIVELYKNANGSLTNIADIWNDFMVAVNSSECKINTRTDCYTLHLPNSYCERIKYLLDYPYLRDDYPLYITYLVLLCFPLANMSHGSNYDYIRLQLSKILELSTEDINTIGLRALCIDDNNRGYKNVWKALERWSLKDGSRGFFKDEISGNGHVYVQRLKNQCLCTLTKADIGYLPEFFRRSNLVYGDEYSLDEYKWAVINKYPLNTILNRNRISKLKNNSKEIETLIEQIADYHKQWDGLYDDETDNRERRISSHHIPLLLELICDDEDNVNIGNFRIKYPDYGDEEEIILENGTILNEERDGWSNSISLPSFNIQKDYHLQTKTHKIKLDSTKNKDIFFFEQVASLSSNTYIQVNVEQNHLLSPYRPIFILFKENTKFAEDVLSWIVTARWYQQYENGNIPNGYVLYCVQKVNTDVAPRRISNYFQKEDENDIHIEIRGGLPINIGYLNDVFPIIECEGIEPSSKICLCHEGETSECVNKEIRGKNGQILSYWWEIANQDEIKSHNEYDAIIQIKNKDIRKKIVFVSATQRPQFDIPTMQISNSVCLKDNRLITNDMNCRFLDDDPNDLTSISLQGEYQDLRDCECNEYNKHQIGNMLINWLYYKGKCSKKELTQVIETLYKSVYGLNYTDKYLTSKIKWLSKAGYILYKNRTVYSLSPRFIVSPRHSGCNKILLIGCRSHSLIKSIIDSAGSRDNNNRDFVRFCVESQNGNSFCRSFPQAISLNTIGTEDNNWGIENAIDVANRCGIEIDNCKTFVKSMFNCLTNIDDVLRTGVWQDTESRQYSLEIYNINDLRYTEVSLLEEQWTADEIYGNKYRLVRRQYNIYEYRTFIIDIEAKKELLVDDTEDAKLFIVYYYCRDLSENMPGTKLGVFKSDENHDLYIKFPLMMSQMYGQYFIMLSGIIPCVEDKCGTKYYHYYLPEGSNWGVIATKLKFWAQTF